MKQNANDSQQEAERRWPSHHKGQHEERNEGKQGKSVRLGLGIAAFQQVISKSIVEEQIRDGSIENFLLKGLNPCVTGKFRLTHRLNYNIMQDILYQCRVTPHLNFITICMNLTRRLLFWTSVGLLLSNRYNNGSMLR